MTDEIKVHVVKKKGRTSLYMRYVDPLTGRQVSKSTGTSRKREAEREAAKWEADLREGRYKAPSKVTWEEFRDRYETEVTPGKAKKTGEKVSVVFNAVEKHLGPSRLADLTTSRISDLQGKLRDAGLAESTIKGTLSHLKAALNWAADVGLLTKLPKFIMPTRAKSSKVMKGRPITLEEFERMLAAISKVAAGSIKKERTRLILKLARSQAVERDDVAEITEQLQDVDRRMAQFVASWSYLLWGLWHSGLRLGEALNLHWTDDRLLCVDFDGRRPMFRIRGEAQKSGQDCILPMSPEFAEFLQATPVERRQGFVFSPQAQRPSKSRMRLDSVSKVISNIGELGSVKVDENAAGKVKFASAHDLRRSFGERWAPRVMPTILRQLMRHESIDTTMKFYVGRNAEAAADVLWAAVGDHSGDTRPETPSRNENSLPQVESW